MKILIKTLCVLATLAVSCSGEKEEPVFSSQPKTLESNDDVKISTVATLTVLKDKEGEGEELIFGDRVRMKVLVLDTANKNLSRSKIVTTRLGSGLVIAGLERTVVGMKVGGQRKVYVPSRLAYGNIGVRSKIRPYQDIIVDVSVLGRL